MKLACIFFGFLSLFFLWSCEHKKKVTKVSPTTFRYSIPANLTTLDPTNILDSTSYGVLVQIHEGLMRLGETSRPELALAKSYEVSGDGKVYTFKLRDGVKFHHGREVNAYDVVWSLNRSCRPELSAPFVQEFLGDIKGVKEVITGTSKAISGIKALDASTVQITLKAPKSYFLAKLASPISFVMPKEFVPLKRIAKVEQVVGMGPFQLKDFVPDQMIVLEAHKKYFGGKPKISKIEIPIIKDFSISIKKFSSGYLDACSVPFMELKRVLNNVRLKNELVFMGHSCIYLAEMNAKRYKPFEDIRIRKAFVMACDKTAMVKELNGVGDPAFSLIPPHVPGYFARDSRYPFDPVEARRLLREGGYLNGKSLPPLELTIPSKSLKARALAESVVTQLNRNLDLKIRVKSMDQKAFWSERNSRGISFAVFDWFSAYAHPANFLSDLYASYSRFNHAGFKNEAFDQLCMRADSCMDEDKRSVFYREAETLLLEQAFVIPLCLMKRGCLVGKDVRGFRWNLMGVLPHQKAIKRGLSKNRIEWYLR